MISHWQIYTIHITAGSDEMDCLSVLCLLFQGVQVFYDRLSLGLFVHFFYCRSESRMSESCKCTHRWCIVCDIEAADDLN